MRIRKNARLGDSVPAEKLQPVVCQLNQSPWDVIPFGSHLIEFEYGGEDDSFAGNANGSAGNNSGGAVESVASPADAEFKSPPNIHNLVVHDNDDISDQNGIAQLDHKAADEENKTTSVGQCKNNQGKKQRQSIYEHDNLSSVRSSKKASAALGVARRTRAQNAKKAPSGTRNPYEFYYYSGFGPLWGKRRGGRNGGSNNKNEVVKANGGEDSTITEANGATIIRSPSTSSQIDTSGFDYDDDEMEEDYDNEEEGGKKRMRKPVKARSLKSLM
ncbi:hypothetical protein K1719_032438 [Acacia pycnantha]|nr:hypothetical protein K1719_032438 [Acacia pycnantha]